VTCVMGSLAQGHSVVITLVTEAHGDAPISNTATITASGPTDPQPANNASTAVITPAPAPIPTASEWEFLILALTLAWIALKKT
jgi:hypothetical protein